MPWLSCAQSKRDAVLVCGHRGGFYNLLPENSLTAIRYTANNCMLQPAVVEVDVRKSKDGTLYILHDETVDRTTNGNGRIEELMDGYLNTLMLKTSSGLLADEHLPEFSEVLTYAKNNNVVLMLDVKDDIWKDVIDLVNKYSLAEKCIALTFSSAVTAKVYNLSHAISISFLAKDAAEWRTIEKLNIPDAKLMAYVTATTDLTLVAKLKQRKIKILADASETMRNKSLLYNSDFYKAMVDRMDLDILITDFPVEVSRQLY
jgi:glycerophosphoryl diester phosphodiesterase